MRYHHDKTDRIPTKGKLYSYNHPLFNKCTLYTRGDRGLVVIQVRFNEHLKQFYLGPIDSALVDDIFEAPGFDDVFRRLSKTCTDGLYPVVELRSLMWELRMKPIAKKWWERSLKIHLVL